MLMTSDEGRKKYAFFFFRKSDLGRRPGHAVLA
jgi:hypothetical protein